MMRSIQNMMVAGTTQSGKTTYTNRMHRQVPGVSIFVDTKGVDPLWGERISGFGDLPRRLHHARKFVYDPPRGADGIRWEQADAALLSLWGRLQGVAKRSGYRGPPRFHVVVDEVHLWQGTGRPNTVQDMAARGLGMGVRLVGVTQHPAGLDTVTRNNLDTRIVFRLGDEGRRCIRSWGWPEERITAWTAGAKYRFASSDPAFGWRMHEPI